MQCIISKAMEVVLKEVRKPCPLQESSESVNISSILFLTAEVNNAPGCFVFSMPFFRKASRTFEHNQKNASTPLTSHADMARCFWRMSLDVIDAFECVILDLFVSIRYQPFTPDESEFVITSKADEYLHSINICAFYY